MRHLKFSIFTVLTMAFWLWIFFAFAVFPANAQNSIPANWKTYSDSKFSFRYPPNFKLKIGKDGIKVFHMTKFRHTDPCVPEDDNGKSVVLDLLEDFNITFKFDRSDFKPDATQELAKENWETVIDGALDTGNLKGKVMLNTSEGCGFYAYSFPAKARETLVVKRLQISLFEPTSYQNGDDKRALKTKNVINPEQEKRIFKTIIESIKIK